jgi:hypothetical protein
MEREASEKQMAIYQRGNSTQGGTVKMPLSREIQVPSHTRLNLYGKMRTRKEN